MPAFNPAHTRAFIALVAALSITTNPKLPFSPANSQPFFNTAVKFGAFGP